MASKLKVPSLQHLAKLCRPDSDQVTRALLALLDNSPTFSYEPLYRLIEDMVRWKTPCSQLEDAVKRGRYREDVRKRYLDILPLLSGFFESRSISFSSLVSPRYYSVDRDLLVPFTPPLLYGSSGALYLPWFMFWENNPLWGERLSLFVTLVSEILKEDSDLEDARLLIVDLSYDKMEQARTLKVTDANDIERLSSRKKKELLATFAVGFRNAQQKAAARQDVPRTEEITDRDQLMLRFAER